MFTFHSPRGFRVQYLLLPAQLLPSHGDMKLFSVPREFFPSMFTFPAPGHPTGHKATLTEHWLERAALNPALLFSLSCLFPGSSLPNPSWHSLPRSSNSQEPSLMLLPFPTSVRNSLLGPMLPDRMCVCYLQCSRGRKEIKFNMH